MEQVCCWTERDISSLELWGCRFSEELEVEPTSDALVEFHNNLIEMVWCFFGRNFSSAVLG